MSMDNVAVPRTALNVMLIMVVVSNARTPITLFLMGNVKNAILIASLASIAPRNAPLAVRISR